MTKPKYCRAGRREAPLRASEEVMMNKVECDELGIFTDRLLA